MSIHNWNPVVFYLLIPDFEILPYKPYFCKMKYEFSPTTVNWWRSVSFSLFSKLFELAKNDKMIEILQKDWVIMMTKYFNLSPSRSTL